MWLALLAVVVVSPFELALFTVPGPMVITTVEAAIVVTLLAWAWTRLMRRRQRLAPGLTHEPAMTAPQRRLAAYAAVFVATLAVAALAAPHESGRALRFAARMGTAVCLSLVAAQVIDSAERARVLARVMVGTAVVVALVAVLEAAQVAGVMTALTTFRPGFHVAGGQLRATSTLLYPTIASMYLEVAFALGLWLLVDPSRGCPRIDRALAFAALAVIGAGISATFTRAGLLAMAVAIATVAAAALARPRRTADLSALTRLTLTLVAVVLFAHSPELLAARLTTEGAAAWYGARYDAPPRVTMTTGAVHRVPVTIANTGRLTWDSSAAPPFFVSYHWLRAADSSVVEFEGQRTPLPTAVRPGQRITVDADVIAPGEPGRYALVWDLVHEERAWLSTEGVAPGHTAVQVEGPRAAPVETRMARLPPAATRPTRPALWIAAVQMARDHPVLGVGPDNFRLTYGRYLGVANADPRVHANNMYLEVLTGAGVVGLAAFATLTAAAGAALWRRLRTAHDHERAGAAAALALWVAVVGHGSVDSFLSFTPIYATVAIAAGWAMSNGLVSGARDAHRL